MAVLSRCLVWAIISATDPKPTLEKPNSLAFEQSAYDPERTLSTCLFGIQTNRSQCPYRSHNWVSHQDIQRGSLQDQPDYVGFFYNLSYISKN